MQMTAVAAEVGLACADTIASEQHGVVGFRQLYAEGVPRWLVRRELRARRWKRRGRQCLTVHNGPLTVEAKRWIAVLELGPRAALRIPLVAWRIDQARVLDALEALFRSRGWLPAAA